LKWFSTVFERLNPISRALEDEFSFAAVILTRGEPKFRIA